MPDSERKTISASEAPALFNASPYMTRWMLWHKFAKHATFAKEEDSRMRWGTDMQPLITKRVAEEKKLEVVPNWANNYVRRGKFGCTRDAEIICPDRGPGALEIKCVFDFKQWMEKWGGGKTVPREYEIQLQTQMMVGDGTVPYDWGTFAVWVCGGELVYFDRMPIFDFLRELEAEANSFIDSVQAGEEPPAFGAICEAPLVRALFPDIEDQKVLDLSDDPDHVKSSEDVSMYRYAKETASGNKKVEEGLRIKLLALAGDAEFVKLPCGVAYRVTKSGKGKTIAPLVPDVPSAPPPPKDNILQGG